MADTRSTPKSPTTPTAADPAATTAAGLSAADTSLSTGTATSPGAEETRSSGILKAGKDEALTEAKAMMRDAADEQRRRAAGAVGGIAGALHRAASDLEPENETIGRYTHLAAQRLDEVADYLRSSRLDDVLSGAEDLARRQPYWFVGGAMAAGFLLARLVKSGASQQRFSGAERTSQRFAASSAAGYGTSTQAGTYPPGPATTSPISSAGAAGTTAPAGATRTEI